MQSHSIDRDSAPVERLGRRCHRDGTCRVACFRLRREAVGADNAYGALSQAVLRIWEGIEFDRDRVVDMHKSDCHVRKYWPLISSGTSTGTKVMNCWPDCITDPTETLATDCTIASTSLRNSTSCRRNFALFNCSRASLALRVAFRTTSAERPRASPRYRRRAPPSRAS